MGDVTQLPIKPAPERGPRFGWWLLAAAAGGVLAVGLALALLLTLGGGDEAPAADPAAARKAVAEAACREHVLAQLKAPATAQIGITTAEQPGPDYYDLTGTVDSENGFGAMIRNTWGCRALVVDGRATKTVAKVGKTPNAIDQELAIAACEDAVGNLFGWPVDHYESESVFADGSGWLVTGEAMLVEYAPDYFKKWTCRVEADLSKAFGGRMVVGATSVVE